MILFIDNSFNQFNIKPTLYLYQSQSIYIVPMWIAEKERDSINVTVMSSTVWQLLKVATFFTWALLSFFFRITDSSMLFPSFCHESQYWYLLYDLNIAAISFVPTVVNRTFYKIIFTGCTVIFTGWIGFSQPKNRLRLIFKNHTPKNVRYACSLKK
jgi:hypothetical protein